MSWRVASSLLTLRNQIDKAYPKRSTVSDGTIGDAAHATRKSDHNPWLKDSKEEPVVTAMDITHDPRMGVDCEVIADAIVRSKDPRVKYIIWNKHIIKPPRWEWAPYTGANPHTLHMHVSVSTDEKLYDSKVAWKIGDSEPDRSMEKVIGKTVLIRGAANPPGEVRRAKTALIDTLNDERGFGPLMEALTKAFQREAGLMDDGKIGGYTWEKLLG
ncbi:MAG TPA: hypothetical protein VH621_05355 [Nitrososphaera sp.]|jgi:peptidoglycan hydrolase-like protein with peptidoglycan-binding domain